MEKRILKASLFGYSKTSVCEYITKVNEEFSEKLIAISDEHKKECEELKVKIMLLENELIEYKRTYSNVTTALLDAQQHAAILKQQAEEENQRLRAKNLKKQAEQTKRIETYKSEIDRVRKELMFFSEKTDKELDDFITQLDAVRTECLEEDSV